MYESASRQSFQKKTWELIFTILLFVLIGGIPVVIAIWLIADKIQQK